MYRTMATTVDLETTPDEDIIVDSRDGTVNAVVVGEPKPLTVSGRWNLHPLPDMALPRTVPDLWLTREEQRLGGLSPGPPTTA